MIADIMPMKTKEEQRAYQRKWLQARRDEWLFANGPCRKCGSDLKLEIDHRSEIEGDAYCQRVVKVEAQTRCRAGEMSGSMSGMSSKEKYEGFNQTSCAWYCCWI